jgi:hypothetical protein
MDKINLGLEAHVARKIPTHAQCSDVAMKA